jgi:hypothetical protein
LPESLTYGYSYGNRDRDSHGIANPDGNGDCDPSAVTDTDRDTNAPVSKPHQDRP